MAVEQYPVNAGVPQDSLKAVYSWSAVQMSRTEFGIIIQ